MWRSLSSEYHIPADPISPFDSLTEIALKWPRIRAKKHQYGREDKSSDKYQEDSHCFRLP